MNKITMIITGFLLVISSVGNVLAYDLGYSLHGVRSSFLLENPTKSKYSTSLLYLSRTWDNTERLNYITRLRNNGDTHIDVYARASRGHLPGGIVDPNENLRPKLKQLNDNGLKPVLWMTGEQRHGDYKVSQAEHEAFMAKTIIQSDDQVFAYVVGLEADEYWDAATVNHYVNFIKARTNKPVAVHLAPGVGGYKKDINYYKNADYIFLQIGNHLTGDYVADVELAKRMLNEALQLGIPVVANEYALHSESAQAKALGDLMCSMGAVGTGNGRSITFCGEETVKKKNDHYVEVAGIAIVALGAYYLHTNHEFDLMLNATENYQVYGIGRSFNVTDNTQASVSFQRADSTYNTNDNLMFYYKGTFKWFD